MLLPPTWSPLVCASLMAAGPFAAKLRKLTDVGDSISRLLWWSSMSGGLRLFKWCKCAACLELSWHQHYLRRHLALS